MNKSRWYKNRWFGRRVDTIAEDVRMIAADEDFQMYLKAVVDSGNRGRTILYAIIIATITVYATNRNVVEPSYLNSRLQKFQKGYQSMLNPSVHTPRGDSAMAYLNRFIFNTRFDSTADTINPTALASHPTVADSEKIREIRKQIDELIRLRTENLTLTTPILGFHMDFNDLGLIAGITFLVLLFILHITLHQEQNNIERANRRAVLKCKDNQELLLMTQAFSVTPASLSPSTIVSFNFVFYLIVCLPIVVHYWVAIEDNGPTKWIGILLAGKHAVQVDSWASHIILVLIIAYSFLCCRDQQSITNLLRDIGNEIRKHRDAQEKNEQERRRQHHLRKVKAHHLRRYGRNQAGVRS